MKFKIQKLLLVAAVLLCATLTAAAQPFLRLPAIIGSHMVLQENASVKLYGWAAPNSIVTVTPSWGEAVKVKTGLNTQWSVEVKTPAASSKTHSITFESNAKASKTIDDVLIGQVWLCSGQSNMNWSAANGIKDMKQELETEMNPQIRLFTVTKNSTRYPQEDCIGQWEVCDAQSALHFSAVGYFFGKKLASELNQPVGLVNSSWGGTPIEVWTPSAFMGKNEAMVASWKEHSKSKQEWQIGTLYNAMIYPLLNTTFAGVVWYQGESNKENATLYGDEFQMMIESWRKAFKAQLPFFFVQIAPHARVEGGMENAIVREQQTRVAATVPETGMVVISDLVDDVTNIHPSYKEGVGNRLAGWALTEVYGKAGGKYKSPIFESVAFEGSRAIVSFANAEGGIVCSDDAIKGLEICDASMKFVVAQGKIDKKKNRLIVWSKEVTHPAAVRYCFSDGAIGNLFDTAGLPVAPFRSDSDNNAAPAKLPNEATTKMTVNAQGEGFELRHLTVGENFFINRDYPLSMIPDRFNGFDMLVHSAIKDSVQDCKVTAAKKGRIYIVTRRNSNTLANLKGWTQEHNSEIRYSTHDKAKPGIVYICYTDVKAGQTITLPKTTDFAGVTLIAAKIDYKQ